MKHNPFSTRHTSPGKIPYLSGAEFTTTESFCAQLHTQWLELGRVSVIIGPHGCGKSTLLATLCRHWSQEYAQRITYVALHDGQRALPNWFWQRDYDANDLVLVDGYEQLGWRTRWKLIRLQRNSACGLLVTAHAAVRLPTLHRVEPAYETLLVVVRRLLAPCGDPPLTERFIQRHVLDAWQFSQRNMRETLFRLYDHWEEEPLPHGELTSCNDQHYASDSRSRIVSSN